MSDIKKIDSLKTYVHIPADEWSKLQAYIAELKETNRLLNEQIEEYNKEFTDKEGGNKKSLSQSLAEVIGLPRW